jgi:restriction endonuclease
MIILSAKEPIDKGKAFEQFISILLSKLGYQVKKTRIRKAGRELDIDAESKVTGLPLLVECKAESQPLGSGAYNKFYGVFEHEAKSIKRGLSGILISLSDFNSEVWANYEEKREKDKRRFKIYGPEFVLSSAVDAGLISDDLTVQHLSKKSWPFELGETILLIDKSFLYRIQILERDGKQTHFIAYRAHCEDPTAFEIETLRTSVPFLAGLEPFDLMARKVVLRALAQSSDPLKAIDLRKVSKQSAATIENEVKFLNERRLLEKSQKGIRLGADLRVFCEVSLELLESEYKYDFVLSPYFQQMNNFALARFCLSRRFIDNPDEQYLRLLNSIFKFSPGALNLALFGPVETYRTTYDHSKRINASIEWVRDSQSFAFIRELTRPLLDDVRDGNKVMDEIDPVVAFLEELHIKIANPLEVFLDVNSSGIAVRMKAGESMDAGNLVTIKDPVTLFNVRMAEFNLQPNSSSIEEMVEIYNDLKKRDPTRDTLPEIANNLGVCLMALQEFGKAKEFFTEGTRYGREIPQLRVNLDRVEACLIAQHNAK